MSGFSNARAGTAIFRAPTATAEAPWMIFSAPREIIQTHDLGAVLDSLIQVEARCQSGKWAAGFIAYEAGPAFDPAIAAHPAIPGLPLLWFGIYDAPSYEPDLPPAGPFWAGPWEPSISADSFRDRIGRIREWIAAGDTYQTNFTFRLGAHLGGDPLGLFTAMVRAQPTEYAAYLDLGEHAICSASPELFFAKSGSRIVAKPMKGTAPRGADDAADEAIAAALGLDPKNRAENLMIVDMVRHDLGRIAEVGSVRVEKLFEVEPYETLFQMTSTVVAESSAGLVDLMRVQFPPASITGAPKPRTSQIIRDLECSPRGVYTGCIGTIAPGGDARLSVAIRTALIDRENCRATYGVGAGIVWDSTPDGEYEECLLKARSLSSIQPETGDFQLLETLAWIPDSGFRNLPHHLARLRDSARFFGYPFEQERLLAALEGPPAGEAPLRVRLLVSAAGEIQVQCSPLAPSPEPVRIALARTPVRSNDPFLHHKTTHRLAYEAARAECVFADDSILWNEEGFVTESTIANLAVRLDGQWFTPPVACGLLAGVGRGLLIESGTLRERPIRVDELADAESLALVSSLRGWRPAVLVEAP